MLGMPIKERGARCKIYIHQFWAAAHLPRALGWDDSDLHVEQFNCTSLYFSTERSAQTARAGQPVPPRIYTIDYYY